MRYHNLVYIDQGHYNYLYRATQSIYIELHKGKNCIIIMSYVSRLLHPDGFNYGAPSIAEGRPSSFHNNYSFLFRSSTHMHKMTQAQTKWSNLRGIGKHLTPASSRCPQLWSPISLEGQSKSLSSSPAHCTLSSKIGPVPRPKPANLTAVAPVGIHKQ